MDIPASPTLPSDVGAVASRPPARPRLWPEARWARWALVALLVFTFLRAVMWSLAFPSFFGPDEDYHFAYIERLTVQREFVTPKEALFPREYDLFTQAMHYNEFGLGPRLYYPGKPHDTTRRLANLPRRDRVGSVPGRGVGVVHPPGYHAPGALVNAALGNSSAMTRYTVLRWYTGVIGVVAVWAAWLLASQVLRPEPLRLLSAFLVSVQPIIAFLSGVVNHDEAVIATYTIASALAVFLMRTPPRAAQGAWLGGAIGLALLVKATSLVLLPLAALAFLAQWAVYRGRGREVLRSVGLALAAIILIAGWWYLRVRILFHTTLGDTPAPGSVAPPFTPVDLHTKLQWAREWTGIVYRTYWFHHFNYEAPRNQFPFYVPAMVGSVGILGIVTFFATHVRRLLWPDDARARQVVLLFAGAMFLYLPLMWTDIGHREQGFGFFMTGGRYLVPAFPGVAVLFILGIRQLVRRSMEPVVFTGVAAVATWFCWTDFKVNYVVRYFGKRVEGFGPQMPDGGWTEMFHHMSWDHPSIVTSTTIWITFVLTLLSLLALALLTAYGAGIRPPGPRVVLARANTGFDALRTRSRAGLRRREPSAGA